MDRYNVQRRPGRDGVADRCGCEVERLWFTPSRIGVQAPAGAKLLAFIRSSVPRRRRISVTLVEKGVSLRVEKLGRMDDCWLRTGASITIPISAIPELIGALQAAALASGARQ